MTAEERFTDRYEYWKNYLDSLFTVRRIKAIKIGRRQHNGFLTLARMVLTDFEDTARDLQCENFECTMINDSYKLIKRIKYKINPSNSEKTVLYERKR